MNCKKPSGYCSRSCGTCEGLAYAVKIEAVTKIKGADFSGSSGAKLGMRCDGGADGKCAVLKLDPYRSRANVFTTSELRELSHFLDTMADKMDGIGEDY